MHAHQQEFLADVRIPLDVMTKWFSFTERSPPSNLGDAINIFITEGLKYGTSLEAWKARKVAAAEAAEAKRSAHAADPLMQSGGFEVAHARPSKASTTAYLPMPPRELYKPIDSPFHTVVCNHGYWAGDACYKCN